MTRTYYGGNDIAPGTVGMEQLSDDIKEHIVAMRRCIHCSKPSTEHAVSPDQPQGKCLFQSTSYLPAVAVIQILKERSDIMKDVVSHARNSRSLFDDLLALPPEDLE